MKWYKLTATSKTGIIKQIQSTYIIAHNKGYDLAADKLYALSQDAIFDNNVTARTIRLKAQLILAKHTWEG
jgi:hypothetical protein